MCGRSNSERDSSSLKPSLIAKTYMQGLQASHGVVFVVVKVSAKTSSSDEKIGASSSIPTRFVVTMAVTQMASQHVNTRFCCIRHSILDD